MKALRVSVLCLAVVVSGSSCGLINNLNEMHDSTGKMAEKMAGEGGMSDTMKGMSDVTGGMADTTDNLFNVTSFTYEDLRQGNAATIRRDQLRAMEQASSQEGKIAAAGVYFNAYEFQLWKQFSPKGGFDNGKKREMLNLNATEEFFRTFKDYAGSDRDVSPSSKSPDKMAVYALAVAVHHVNPNQELDSEHRGFETTSMLNLIERAIEDAAKLRDGRLTYAEMPESSREIATNLDLAMYLMQVRFNFLAAMTLSKISDIEKGFFVQLGMLLGNWEGKFDKLNEAQIRTYTKWMKEANRTARFVRQFAKPEIDGNMGKVYSNLVYDGGKLHRVAHLEASSGIQASVANWNQAIDELLKEIARFRVLIRQCNS